MTRTMFLALCAKYTIDPDLALESPKVRAALAARDDAELERLLAEEF